MGFATFFETDRPTSLKRILERNRFNDCLCSAPTVSDLAGKVLACYHMHLFPGTTWVAKSRPLRKSRNESLHLCPIVSLQKADFRPWQVGR